jgi:hypothetical protein
MKTEIKFVQVVPESVEGCQTITIAYPGKFHQSVIAMKGEQEAHFIINTADDKRLFIDVKFREEEML